MKILFLNYEYPPLGGGAGNATAYLLREYARMPDLEVHLVTSAIGFDPVREAVSDRVMIHRIPIGKDAGTLHHQSRRELLTYAWKGYRYARALLREERFDVVHAFFTIPGGFQALLLHTEFRVPYVVSLRGADVPGYSERFPVIYALVRPLVRRIWNRAAAVVANSAGLRELALRTSPRLDIPVIPNGVETDEFTSEGRTSSETFRILVVSRLTPRKGIRFLVRSMRLLREANPDRAIELHIAGGGDEEEVLKSVAESEGVSDIVRFLGRVPHEELPNIYRDADIFCLPSLNEGMSNTVLEAISSGLPIVATVTGGTEELVRDGDNGFFVQMESPEDLADKIGRLIADSDLCARMGAASRKRAEMMSWRAVAKRYVDVYDDVSRRI